MEEWEVVGDGVGGGEKMEEWEMEEWEVVGDGRVGGGGRWKSGRWWEMEEWEVVGDGVGDGGRWSGRW